MPSRTNNLLSASSNELIRDFYEFLKRCLECYIFRQNYDFISDEAVDDLEARQSDWLEFYTRDVYQIAKQIYENGQAEALLNNDRESMQRLQRLYIKSMDKRDLHNIRMEKWKGTKYEDLFNSLDSALEGDADTVDKELLKLAKLRNDYYLEYNHAPEEDYLDEIW